MGTRNWKEDAELWLVANYDKMPKGEWVAYNDMGLIAHHESAYVLYLQLEKKKMALESMLYACIPADLTETTEKTESVEKKNLWQRFLSLFHS